MSRLEQEFVCRVHITHRGREFQLGHTINQLDLDKILPWRAPVDPMDFAELARSEERRQRFVDIVSANIAMALTNALLDR